VPWVGKHILRLGYDITVFENGSGDTTYNYVLVVCFLALAAAATLIIIWRRRSRVRDRLAMPTDMPRHDLVSPGTDRSPMPAQPVGFATQSSYQQQPFAGPAQQPAGYWTPPSQVIAMDGQ
jgi:hypothetical protein